MAQLNYVPHEAARVLALRRTRVLGAVIPTLNNAIFAEGVNAFERAAHARGYTLLLSLSNYDLEEEQNLVRKMMERGVEGLLLIGNEHGEACFDGLNAAGVRHLCAWAHSPDSPAPNVGFSNAAAVADLVDHLVDLGHRRISLLAGVTVGNDRARERVRGIRERMVHHGLKLPPEHIIETPYSIREARRLFPKIMQTKPTAVMCGNDVIAYGALFEAQAMSLSVPGDVSITGFDNLRLSAELHPGITTVNVPAADMGTEAANALIDAIEEERGVRSRELPTELLIRGTTGPAPR